MPRRPWSTDVARPRLPTVVLRGDQPAGVAAAQVRERRWEQVRRGAFVSAVEDPDRFARRRHLALARIVAVGRQLTMDHVISHESAALLWGLPLVTDGSTVHVVQGVNPNRWNAPDVRRHRHALDPHDVVELAGRRVTTLERTVLDCASSLPAQDGLVLADASLRRGLDLVACRATLDSWWGRRGVARARAVLEVADDGAESAGETRLRHVLLRAGLPAPATQIPISTRDGDYWSDLGWEPWRLLLEYDGLAKYGAGAASDVVLRERRREVAIERWGWRILRFTARDLNRPDAVVADVLRWAPTGTSALLRPRIHLT